MFNVDKPHGTKLLTPLRVGLSHSREHKFKYIFQVSLDPFCNCDRYIETIHFFLNCLNYSNQRKTLLFGSNGLSDEENALIIESTIE